MSRPSDSFAWGIRWETVEGPNGGGRVLPVAFQVAVALHAGGIRVLSDEIIRPSGISEREVASAAAPLALPMLRTPPRRR